MNAIFNLESNVNCIVEENYTNFEETIRNSSPWNTQMNHQMVMYLVASLKKVGLFTEKNWSGSPYKKDTNAFLFSFINKHDTKLIMKCANESYAITPFNSFGPTFGPKQFLFRFRFEKQINLRLLNAN